MRYIFNLIIFLSAGSAVGQVTDSLKADFSPTGLRIGIDAIALVYAFSDERISSQQFIAEMDLYRYFLVAEYGRYDRTRDGSNGLYNTKGGFWRIGADVNFLQHDPDQSVLSFGLRYGNSRFSDQLNTIISDPVYGTKELSFRNDDLHADWFELVAGLRVPVWKLWLGYTARLKFGVDKFEDNDFRPYEIPGYGLGAEKDYWEFNYYLMYRISWKDKKIPPRIKQ